MDFSKMPSAGEVLSRYQSNDKPEVFTPRGKANPGTTHPVGGYYPQDLTDDPAPRQESRWDLTNPNLYDRSESGARFIELHGGTNITNDPNLSATQRRQIFNGELPSHKPEPGLTAAVELSEEEALTEQTAEMLVTLNEQYGLSVGECFDCYFLARDNPDLSLSEIYEAVAKEFRPDRVQRMVAELNDLKRLSRAKIGTSKSIGGDAKPKPTQTFKPLSAGQAIAAASSGVIGKKKQTDGNSKGVSNGIGVNESYTAKYMITGRLAGF